MPHEGASSREILHIAQVVPCTEAEGPGKRYAIWFQGCPLRCPGCCNPEYLPFRGGEAVRTEALIEHIRQTPEVEGITLLGGEPMAHAEGAVEVARAVRAMGRTVMVFTGFLLEELRHSADTAVRALVELCDILVDGPYLRDHPDTQRRWIGSTNQRIHFLTDRYSADDPCWKQRNTLEIRLRGDSLAINGFPAPSAVGLWKGFAPGARRRPRPTVE